MPNIKGSGWFDCIQVAQQWISTCLTEFIIASVKWRVLWWDKNWQKKSLAWAQRYFLFGRSETNMVESLLHLRIIVCLKTPLWDTKSSWCLLVHSVQNGEVWRFSQLGMLRCSQSSAQSYSFMQQNWGYWKDWGKKFFCISLLT